MTDASNAAMVEYWQTQGQVWVDAQARMDRMLAPLTDALIDGAALSASDRVIDVGCGCGDTTLTIADRTAQAWGVDVSAPMLARARERAGDQANIRFSEEDAASADFTAEHDLIFSRFGVMFFADPAAAFANLRRALVPTGRLCFLCWQKPRSNPWMSIVGAAIAHLLPEPETPPDPRAPGPFAFADPDYLQDILQSAGYANIDLSPVTQTLHVADTVDEALVSLSEIGPLARALKELEGEVRDEAIGIARATLGEHFTDDGVNLGAACWLVRATQS
ncbi:MAG: class I SAM-dependent methyltransferase [Pseudomonadota bacterium]